MAYSTWLMDVISDEFRTDSDVPVRAVDGWKSRGRSADHAGVMDHHWGSRPGTRYAAGVEYITFNSPIAPSANICTGSPYAPDLNDFPITVCAAGKCNHAGAGDLEWLDTNDGNFRMLGLEHYSTYDHDDWHPRHLEIQMRLNACLLEHMGQSYLRRADHKEYALPAGRKVDRHHIDTGQWDIDLRDLMAARAEGVTDMPLTQDDIDKIAEAVRDIPVRHRDRLHGGPGEYHPLHEALSIATVNATVGRRGVQTLIGDLAGLRTVVRDALADAGLDDDVLADKIVSALAARLQQ